MAEERLQRLAAILSADVVGYSRLMGLDEAGTLSRLNALRRELIDPAIAAHSGRRVVNSAVHTIGLYASRYSDFLSHLKRFSANAACQSICVKP